LHRQLLQRLRQSSDPRAALFANPCLNTASILLAQAASQYRLDAVAALDPVGVAVALRLQLPIAVRSPKGIHCDVSPGARVALVAATTDDYHDHAGMIAALYLRRDDIAFYAVALLTTDPEDDPPCLHLLHRNQLLRLLPPYSPRLLCPPTLY
jgi:hypothetical protein